MPVEDYILPVVILGSLYYYTKAMSDASAGGGGAEGAGGTNTSTPTEDTDGIVTEGSGGSGSTTEKPLQPPKPQPPKPLPPWATTLFAVNDVAKDLIGDVVTAKMISALLNESGQRKMLAEHRANVALKKKQESAMMKLAVLEQKKAKLLDLNKNYNAKIENAKILSTQKKADAVKAKQDLIAQQKARIQSEARAKFSRDITAKYGGDVTKAKQESTTKSKLVSTGGNRAKGALGIIKQRIQNTFAKITNTTRAQYGKQIASIKLPKFTLRSTVHSGASVFGLLVASYDLVRMFDPKIDLWKGNRKTGTAPVVEEVPYPPFVPLPTFNYPLCDDVVENGIATPTNPVLCRENRPKPWEYMSKTGLGYVSDCPPGFRDFQFGVYTRCTLATNFSGEWVNNNTPYSRWGNNNPSAWKSMIRNSSYASTTDTSTREWNSSGDYIDPNMPNVYASVPESYFVNLGLRQFVNDLNTYINSVVDGEGKPIPERSFSTAPETPTWSSDVAFSIDTPMKPFNPKRFDIVNLNSRDSSRLTAEQIIANAYTGADQQPPRWAVTANDLTDPDWPYQQFQNRDDWGRYEGARVTNARFLGDFPKPYTDIGLTVRGGEKLTDEQRMKILFPDATEDEIDSAVEANNAEDIQDIQEKPQRDIDVRANTRKEMTEIFERPYVHFGNEPGSQGEAGGLYEGDW